MISTDTIDPATVDMHLDAVLRAAGSALRHYSMQKTLDDMRTAMRAALSEAVATSAFNILTNEQIAAGAAVLGDDGKPIGRNTAIMVADAMSAAQNGGAA